MDLIAWVSSKRPAAAKVLLDTPDRVFEHVADFARLEMPEPPEDELVFLLSLAHTEADVDRTIAAAREALG